MGMRITTNMMMNTYRYNLSNSTLNLDDARDKVLTQRKFNSYAEDPATASHAWRVRRSLTRNAGYQTTNTEAYSRFNIAWSTMASMDDPDSGILNGSGGAFAAIKRADNEPTGGARTALGTVLKNLAESVIFSMNGAKYGDQYIFAGNDELNAPFSWDGDTLLYRGINVSAGGVTIPSKAPDWTESKMIPAGTPYLDSDEYMSGTALDKAWVEYYRGEGEDPSQRPDWADDYENWLNQLYNENLDPNELPRPESVPEVMSAKDTAWFEHINFKINGPDPMASTQTPMKPDEEQPDWITDPPYEVPKDMPKLEDASSNWEKAWVQYYKNDQDPDQNPAELIKNVPGWLEKDGKMPTMEDFPEWAYGMTFPQVGGEGYPEDDDYLGKAWLDFAYDQRDLAMLNAMSAEVKNMDVGLGLQEETGNRDLIQSTAFNRAIPGINMIGYGVDEDGDPKNIACIMLRLAELYGQCNDEGKYGYTDEDGNFVESKEVEDEVFRLLDKFTAAHNEFNKGYSEVDTRAQFLTANGERLKDQGYTLKEQIADLEQVDMAEALMDFSWSYYCFSSALKIGNQLLSQSLIDYMS